MPTALRTWRLRSSRAHSDRKVQQCPLRAEVGEEIGDELARRKWTWNDVEVDADMVEENLEEREGGGEGVGGGGGGGGGEQL